MNDHDEHIYPPEGGALRLPKESITEIREISVSIPLDPYLSLRALSGYPGLSVRTLRYYLTEPVRLLPHYRAGGSVPVRPSSSVRNRHVRTKQGGKILVRRSDFDAWITAYRRAGDADIDQIVAEVLYGLA
jgi:hypothetical protein